jgi:F-type H+-transporting ATPase subunit b
MVFPPFTQLSTFASQIFWLAVAFLILYVAVAYYFLPKIRSALEARDGQIAKDVAAAAAASQTAEAAVKELEASMAQARARSRETAAQARAVADKQAAAETAKVEAQLNAQLADAEKRIGQVRASAMSNVAGVAEETAAAIAERIIGVKPSAAAAKAAVARALNNTAGG